MKQCILKTAGLTTFGFLLFTLLWVVFPFPHDILETYPAVRTLTDREGKPLRVSLGPNDTHCDPIALHTSRTWAVDALVAAEDKRFFSHPGIDPLAILRSLWINMRARDVRTGASTLSTQVIRLAQPRDRTLRTKVVEAFRALQMEQQYSKREVLEQYLNRAPFGSNLIGIQAASRSYFNKDAADLSLAEASLLMGLPQSPSRFRPDRHLDRALKRRDYVLDRMEALQQIRRDQGRRARSQSLEYLGRQPLPFAAPHFCDLVDRTRIRPGRLASGQVRTTLDSGLQNIIEEVFSHHRNRLQAEGIFGGAVVVIEVESAAVRALMGAPDFFDTAHAGQVNVATAPRSPGSALKPFAFLLAFDQGRYTPESVMADVPMHFREYQPENFSEEFSGLVTVRESLVQSLNIPALRLVRELGLPSFIAYLQHLGLTSINRPACDYGLSVVLGTAEVQLLNLANAYAALAREGEWRAWRLLENEPARPGRRISSRGAAWMVTDILSGDERALEAEGHLAESVLSRVAWKTGTSNGLRDAWTVAYNPEYVVGVWVGNPDGRGAPGLVGIHAAAPVALDVFRRLYPDGEGPWFDRPPGVGQRSVCTASGWLTGPYCETSETAVFISGRTEPKPCPVHRNGPAPDLRHEWPVEVVHFQRLQGKAVLKDNDRAAAPPRIVSPMPGSVYRVLDATSRSEQTLTLKAVAGSGPLFWFMDGRLLGKGKAAQPLYWRLARGTHRLNCSDQNGYADQVEFRVE